VEVDETGGGERVEEGDKGGEGGRGKDHRKCRRGESRKREGEKKGRKSQRVRGG